MDIGNYYVFSIFSWLAVLISRNPRKAMFASKSVSRGVAKSYLRIYYMGKENYNPRPSNEHKFPLVSKCARLGEKCSFRKFLHVQYVVEIGVHWMLFTVVMIMGAAQDACTIAHIHTIFPVRTASIFSAGALSPASSGSSTLFCNRSGFF